MMIDKVAVADAFKKHEQLATAELRMTAAHTNSIVRELRVTTARTETIAQEGSFVNYIRSSAQFNTVYSLIQILTSKRRLATCSS